MVSNPFIIRITGAMGDVRIGTSGWSYPSGKGKWNGLFYPATRSKRAGTDQFDELRFYCGTLRYGRGQHHVLRAATPRRDSRLGLANAAGFEFSLKLYQKFTHPKMFKDAALKRAPGAEGALLDLLAEVTQSDIDDFRAGIDPLASAGKVGALLAQFPPSFKDTAAIARLPRAAAARVCGLPGGGGAAPQELERRYRRDAVAAQRVRRGVGPDRRAEVPFLDPAELPAKRDELLLHAAARQKRRAVVAARQERGSL